MSNNPIKHFSTYLECSVTTTPKVSSLKDFISMLSKMGYNEFYLGLTDAYKIPEYPYFNYKRGYYSKEDLSELEQFGQSVGVTVIPAIQVLGHLEYLKRHGCFQDILDNRCILEVGNPKAYEFLDCMLKSISESFKGRRVHVGMDETFGIGTGNYLKHNPPKDKKALLLEYLQVVVEKAKKYNLEIEIWGDGLIDKENTSVTAEDVKRALPKNTLVWQWEYNNKNINDIEKSIDTMRLHSDRMGFSGSAWRIQSYSSANHYSISRLVRQIDACKNKNVDNFMITIWGDNGMPSSMFSVLPSLFIASEYNLGKDYKNVDKDKFKSITGVSFDDMMLLDRMDDPFHRRKGLTNFKTPDYLNSESFILLFNDLLIGSYDMLLTRGVNKKYLVLSNKFKKVQCDERTKHVFNMMSQLSKVIGLKCELGLEIREAYAKKDIETLKIIADKKLPKAIKAMKDFIKVFNSYFMHEWQTLGLEVEQLYHSHVLSRLEFVKERILDFINNGTELDEIKNPSLVPSYDPPISEDVCLLNWHQWLFSYCLL